MFAALNQHQPDTLPRNTMQNPKNYGHYLAIISSSDKEIINPPMTLIYDISNDFVSIEDETKKFDKR